MSKSRVLWTLLVISIACFWYSFALADGGGSTPTAPPDLSALWPMIGLAIATVWGYVARYITATKFATLHNTPVHLGITLVGMLISGAEPVFKSGHVTWVALAWAVMGVLPTFLAGLNHPVSDTPAAPSVITKAGALLPLLIGLSLLSGCAHMSPSQKAYADAFGACMEKKGLAVAPDVGAEAWSDLTNGTDKKTIIGQLDGLAARAGLDAVTCAVQAWLGPVTPGAAIAPKNQAGLEAAQAFLKAHS